MFKGWKVGMLGLSIVIAESARAATPPVECKPTNDTSWTEFSDTNASGIQWRCRCGEANTQSSWIEFKNANETQRTIIYTLTWDGAAVPLPASSVSIRGGGGFSGPLQEPGGQCWGTDWWLTVNKMIPPKPFPPIPVHR